MATLRQINNAVRREFGRARTLIPLAIRRQLLETTPVRTGRLIRGWRVEAINNKGLIGVELVKRSIKMKRMRRMNRMNRMPRRSER